MNNIKKSKRAVIENINNKKHLFKIVPVMKGRIEKMEKRQKINCTVETCKYNNNEYKECDLESITVTPIKNCNTRNCDESQCSSYMNIQK